MRLAVLRWLAVLVGGVLLCGPALLNGGAILFPDTVAYVIDGDRLFHLTAPLNVRPVFYGLAIRFLHWDHSLWPVLLAQGVVVSHLLLLTLRAVGAPMRALPFVVLTALLAALTPLAWTVSHALPDAFAGVLILSLFLLACCADRLTGLERAYLIVLATAACCFHLTHLVLGLALAAAVLAAYALRPLWRPGLRPLLVTAPPVLALLAFALFSLALYQRLSLAPNSPPYLLARVIADGPGRDYLRQSCPVEHYAICPYLDQLPPTEEGILWRFLPAAPVADGRAIKAEASRVIDGTIAAYPLQVAAHMLENTARQFVSIRATLDFDDASVEGLQRFTPFMQADYRGSLQAKGQLGALLPAMNAVHAAVALAGLAACLWFGAACLAHGVIRPALLIGTVLFALSVNAFASGALSGVFDRYQGRIIWLLPFAGVAAGRALMQGRTKLVLGAARTE